MINNTDYDLKQILEDTRVQQFNYQNSFGAYLNARPCFWFQNQVKRFLFIYTFKKKLCYCILIIFPTKPA